MKIMVIDGNSIVNRAFYGVRPLTNAEGLNTNAVYGFLTIYFKILEEEAPDGVCVAFDLRAPTFRHKEYEGYKANRKGMPDELAEQMPYLKEVLDALSIKRYECEGYEADDIIGTISRKCKEAGDECVIVTGDRDSFQLIENDGTNVLLVTSRMGKTETVRYNGAALFEKYGLPPELMRDLKGLMGDSSDNIPGVAGIGEKTALGLVSEFGSIDEIYENIDSPKIRDSVRNKLIAGKEMAYLSKKLGTICQTAPISYSAEDAILKEYNNDELFRLFSKLEFRSLIARLNITPPNEEKQEAREKREIKSIRNRAELSEAIAFPLAVMLSEDFAYIGLATEKLCYTVSSADFSPDEYKEILSELMNLSGERIVCDVKTLRTELLSQGISASGEFFDIALGAYVLDSGRKRYDLLDISHMLGDESIDADFLKISDEAAFSPLTGAEEGLSALARCAECELYLSGEIKRRLSESGTEKLYYDIELPLTETLFDMERSGVRVNSKELLAYGEKLSQEISALEEEIYTLSGERFNILSPKQLGVMLFETLGIPAVKKTKTGYSTDADVLSKLVSAHPIIPLIIEYRKYTKLKSTYVDGLLKFISEKDGKIHTTFRQMVTATGRLSSTDPNLQNIPVRSELGGELRRMFEPQNEEYCFIDADYSQIELRVLAHVANDGEMISAFKENKDIHAETASQVFGVSEGEVTAEMRRVAKAVNFGIVYGISEFSLAEDIGVSRFEAKRYIEAYLNHYAGVRDYMKGIVESAKKSGYVKTLLSRRRYIPEISSKNFNIRSFGERVALNAPIQGTAADIIKIAMNRVACRLKKEGLDARLILQVHDELIVEAKKDIAEKAAEILREEMENAFSLNVPLVADAGLGDTWYDAKK